MKTKEEKQKKFVTKFEINGENTLAKYGLLLGKKLKILLNKEKQQKEWKVVHVG